MPDRTSEQVKPTVTLVLFQPLTLGAGLRVALIEGAVLSSLTVTEPEPLLPSRSVAVALLLTPFVSSVTLAVAGVGPLPTPDPPVSVALQVMVTTLLFQP